MAEPGPSAAAGAARPLLVIDASVVVKWLAPERVDEPDRPEALALLRAIDRDEVDVLQPAHWLLEVGAALARIRAVEIEDVLDELTLLDFEVANSGPILRRACRLAGALQHHAFDTAYHAVALESGGVLVTADERYERRARDVGRVLPLRDWRLAFRAS